MKRLVKLFCFSCILITSVSMLYSCSIAGDWQTSEEFATVKSKSSYTQYRTGEVYVTTVEVCGKIKDIEGEYIFSKVSVGDTIKCTVRKKMGRDGGIKRLEVETFWDIDK